MKTVVDLVNLSPLRPLNGEIPKEVWPGKKSSHGYLRVFGCKAFVHIMKDERAKLDAKANECIYLGSRRDELGFRLWDPINKKIVRSRDVMFFEDQTIHDIQRFEKPKPILRNLRGETLLREVELTQMIETNQVEQPSQIEQLDQMEQS